MLVHIVLQLSKFEDFSVKFQKSQPVYLYFVSDLMNILHIIIMSQHTSWNTVYSIFVHDSLFAMLQLGYYFKRPITHVYRDDISIF